MDWRGRLADYNDARFAHSRAERLLADAVLRHEIACMSGDAPALAPLSSGVDLARRRARREDARLARATARLTGGRSLDEVLWSLPDDI